MTPCKFNTGKKGEANTSNYLSLGSGIMSDLYFLNYNVCFFKIVVSVNYFDTKI